MGKTKRQLADEAYERVFGQVELEDDIALAAQEAARGPIAFGGTVDASQVYSSLPGSCPCCETIPENHFGLLWVHMRGDGDVRKVQCAACGHTISVTREVWEQVREIARAKFANADVAPVKVKKPKRERGAG